MLFRAVTLVTALLISRPSYNFVVRASLSTMRIVNNDGNGGEGITLIPQNNQINSVVVFMHGLGDTADGWADAMHSLNMPNTKFILPTAKVRPISLNGGYPMTGWFDIRGLSFDAPEDRMGFEDSMDRINRLVQSEIDKGVPSNKIVIGGFSQGGALALYTSLRSGHALGGCIVLSAWLAFKGDYTDENMLNLSPHASRLRIFQAHGTADNVVSYKWGEGSHEIIKKFNPGAKLLSIPGMGHSSHPSELAAIREFINNL